MQTFKDFQVCLLTFPRDWRLRWPVINEVNIHYYIHYAKQIWLLLFRYTFMITFESTCTMITTQTMTWLYKIEVIARVKLSRASMNKNEHDGCDRPYLVDGSHQFPVSLQTDMLQSCIEKCESNKYAWFNLWSLI